MPVPDARGQPAAARAVHRQDLVGGLGGGVRHIEGEEID